MKDNVLFISDITKHIFRYTHLEVIPCSTDGIYECIYFRLLFSCWSHRRNFRGAFVSNSDAIYTKSILISRDRLHCLKETLSFLETWENTITVIQYRLNSHEEYLVDIKSLLWVKHLYCTSSFQKINEILNILQDFLINFFQMFFDTNSSQQSVFCKTNILFGS